jgi:hypothetical protein
MRSTVQRILQRAKWKIYVPRLLHAANEDDPDRSVQFCEWFQHKAHEYEGFVSKIVWSDEATMETLREEIETSRVITVDTLTKVARAPDRLRQYKLMVCTLNTCSNSTCVAAIPFCVYRIWITNKLFKLIFCIEFGLPINYLS